MINSATLELIINEFQTEQADISNKLAYAPNKKDILKHSTIINNILKHLITYNEKYVIIDTLPKINESIVQKEITKYNIKSLIK